MILAALVIAGIIATVIAAISIMVRNGAEQTPGAGTVIVASDLSKAHATATDGTSTGAGLAAAEYLSQQPTAYWLTPEVDGVDQVAGKIAHLSKEAREQNADLGLVIYGLPERDCGNYSAGGLAPADYEAWTAAIGDALRRTPDQRAIVALEPDSLALAPQCGNVSERVTQLRAAVAALSAPNVWIYLDGGHSNWLPASEMASLIAQVGIDSVRGFTTNVSNYNDTASEVSYAHAVAKHLGGGHAIIDTSRNGAGSNGEWCNPTGRLVGEPGGSIGDDVVDTNLWIKPPGESDGTCNGGPTAGLWWAQSAIELTRESPTG